MPLPRQTCHYEKTSLLGGATEDVDQGSLFARLYHHSCNGCCNWKRQKTTGPKYVSFIEKVVSKFILEVMGAAGALWGCADFLNFRDTTAHEENVRALAILFGFIFATRYWWHVKNWWEHERDYLPIESNHRTDMLAFFQSKLSVFVLQVMGGAGAVWGAAEVVKLRDDSNRTEWTTTATVVGLCFFIRFGLQILGEYKPMLWSDESSVQMKIHRWFEATAVKFDLEVLGAGGAVWGASEVATLRTVDTLYIWRPVSAIVGFVYTIRWILLLNGFIQSENRTQVQIETDVEDLKLLDERKTYGGISTEHTQTESGDDSL